MKLYSKFIIGLSVVFVLLFVVFYFTLRVDLARHFSKVERDYLKRDMQRAAHILEAQVADLNSVNYDWACWDDTCAFVAGTNPQFEAANLMDATFVGMHLNLMAFFNEQGELVYSKAFDPAAKKSTPLTLELNKLLAPDSLLVRRGGGSNIVSGIVMLPENPLLVSARPVLDSHDGGPVRGTLVMGRYLDPSLLERFSSMAQFDLDILRINDPRLRTRYHFLWLVLNEILRNPEAPANPFLTQISEPGTISAYRLTTDVFGQPAFFLATTQPRDSYAQGLQLLNRLSLVIAAFALALAILVLALLERHVLKRLRELGAKAGRVARLGDFSSEIKLTGRDELSHLAQDINNMLQSLAQATRRLREADARDRFFVEHFQGLAFQADQDLRPAFVRGAVQAITGYTEAELMQQPDFWKTIIHPEDLPALQQAAAAIIRNPNTATSVENRLVRKDKTIRWMRVHARSIQDAPDRPPMVLGAGFDETDRKEAENGLRHSREELRRLSMHLQNVREDECARLACRLHDDVGQLLAALKIEASWLQSHLKQEEAQPRLQAIRNLVDDITAGLQDISRELKPSVLASLSLPEALEWLTRDFAQRTHIPCQLALPSVKPEFDKAAATAIFRIVQEALTNIARHAEATAVAVGLTAGTAELELVIRDNGRGICEEAVHSLNSFGLIQIRERAAFLHGRAEISSTPGQGTLVRILFPFQPGPQPEEAQS